MMAADSKRADARRYMDEARALLTDLGLVPAATYLDYAIASIDRADEMDRSDDDPVMIPPHDPVLVRAMGGAMTILGTVLARSDLVELDELGRLFGLFATVSARHDPAMGTIVAGWGGMILSAAQELDRPPG